MIGGKADITARERLLKTDREPVLIAASNKGHAARRAHSGICVGLGESYSFGRKPVDIRRGVVPAAIAGEVGITKIIRKYEEDIRLRVSGER